MKKENKVYVNRENPTPLLQPLDLESAMVCIALQIQMKAVMEGKSPRDALKDLNIVLPVGVKNSWRIVDFTKIASIEWMKVGTNLDQVEAIIQLLAGARTDD